MIIVEAWYYYWSATVIVTKETTIIEGGWLMNRDSGDDYSTGVTMSSGVWWNIEGT